MSCRLSVISVFILSSVPLSRLEKSSSHFAFPLADLKSVSGLISFIKEHELLKAQEAAKSRPYSAFVTLPWPLGLEGAVPLHGATSRRSGSMLLWAGRLLRFRGKGVPFYSRQLGRISWEISLCCKNRAACCRSAVRPLAWLLWSCWCCGLWGWRLCSFTLFSAEIKSLFVFQIYGKVLNCLSLIALGNPILCC